MPESPVHDSPAPPPKSPRQVMLGLFILFQLGFLIATNLLGFIKWVPTEVSDKPKALINRLAPGFADERRHGWHWSDQVETNLRRWVQLTGQDQDWALFAPAVSKTTGFPAVVLVWDEATTEGPSIPGTMLALDAKNGFSLCADWSPAAGPSPARAVDLGMLAAQSPWEVISLNAVRQLGPAAAPRTVLIFSDNEPTDIHNFIRFGQCRLRRYEGQFFLNTRPYLKEDDRSADESPNELAQRMSRRMRTLVYDYQDPAIEYMKWRCEAWMKQHPGEPAPKQILLMQRFYRIRGPKEEDQDGKALQGWDGPLLIPMLRFQPEAPRRDNYYLLEAFDFADSRFHALPR